MTFSRIDLAETPTTIRETISNASRSLWFGALSFEERCTASIAALATHGVQLTEGVALNYPSDVHPAAVAKAERARNWNLFQTFEKRVFSNTIRKHAIEPYSFQALQDSFEEAIENVSPDFVVLDITCLTKIHALALAAVLSQTSRSFSWTVVYTLPENYSGVSEMTRVRGWRDIIIAPLAETAQLFYESHSRGIIFPGHESDRLIVALAEIEPSGGTILSASAPRRPDLEYMSEQNNKKITRRLTRLRYGEWTKFSIKLFDYPNLRRRIITEVELAKKFDSPVILFPFGPKPMAFFAAFELCANYPDASWFVYPVPSGYDVHYSEGVERTLWMTPMHLTVSEEAVRKGIQRRRTQGLAKQLSLDEDFHGDDDKLADR